MDKTAINRRNKQAIFRNKISDKREKIARGFVFALGPWMCFWMVETLNQNNLIEDFFVWQVFMNLIWYYLLFFLLRLIMGGTRRAATAGALFLFAVGLLNHYILRFRGRIIFPADLAGWKTAANVADGFDFSFDLMILQSILILIAYLGMVFWCQRQKGFCALPRAVTKWLVLFMAGYTFAFFGTGMLPALGVYTQQWATQHNGFILNFTVAMRYSSIEKPKGYSKQAALDLLKLYDTSSADTGADENQVKPENIIVIMNEAFSDLTIFEQFQASEDPTPFLHSMQENTVKGLLYAPVTGGGTASTEFEFITGFSAAFQPPHTVAYQLYVSEDMPSFSSLAKDQGYETIAFHPYKASGWNRPLAYQYLNFAQQYFEPDVTAPKRIRQYVSDQSSYEKIIQLTEETNQAGKRAFILNVTMQNHSGFAQGWHNLPRDISTTEALMQADSGAQQYLNLVRASDDALKQLISYYDALETPTMIVFFGDHQPSLKNEFYEVLYEKPLDQRSTEEILLQYAVPFFIWTNYDSQKADNVHLSANYLAAYAAKMAGLELSSYANFLLDLSQDLPIITPVGMKTDTGEYYTKSELPDEYAARVWQYEVLNYCGIKDLFDQARPYFK